MPSRETDSSTQTPGITAADLSTVFLVKSLLYPVAAVLVLGAALLGWREPLTGPYLLIAVLAFIGVAEFLDVARSSPRQPPLLLRWLIDIVLRWVLVLGFIWGLLRLSGLGDYFDHRVMLTWAMATPVVLWLSQNVAHYLLNAGLRRLPARRAVIVGLTDLGSRLEELLHGDRLLNMEVIGYFDDRSPERLPASRTGKILGKAPDLPDFIFHNHVDVVYIMLPITRHPRIMDLVESLSDSTVSIYFVPDVFVFNTFQARLDVVNGIPMVALCETPFYGGRGMVKRLMDVCGAAALLVGLSPVMAAVALAVKRSSPGPVIFKQRRYGLNGHEIFVYKFRTMTVTEDGAQVTQATKNDSRLTPVGAFLRRYSLDELPQLINVLQGRMSLVGPRPHAVAHNEEFRKLIRGYMMRHKMLPGMTGLAQVNGCRGEIAQLDDLRARVEYDLEYLRRWSPRLDVAIIFKTVGLVWNDHKAY